MSDPGYVKGKTKNEILDNYLGTAAPGSAVGHLEELGILVRCTEDIEKAIGSLGDTLDSLKVTVGKSAESANELSSKVLWLNVILTVATVVYAAVTVYQVFFKK